MRIGRILVCGWVFGLVMGLGCDGAGAGVDYTIGMSLSPSGVGGGSEGGRVVRDVTVRTLCKMASSGEVFSALTAYDATTARWLARAGVHVLLVGDTAAEMVLGFDRTIDMPLDVLVALTAGVWRGANTAGRGWHEAVGRPMVMADMPFLSYQADDAEGVRNAGRFVTEGRADVVKVEADASMAGLIRKMARAGIAVCAHVGSRPQTVGLTGGYSSAGRSAESAARVIEDARALEDAGAAMLLIEAVPDEVGAAVVSGAKVPVIGIGAGLACHGQVLVFQDLVGLTDVRPRFADPVAEMGRGVMEAGREWVRRVAERRVGGKGYAMGAGESERLSAMVSGGGVAGGVGSDVPRSGDTDGTGGAKAVGEGGGGAVVGFGWGGAEIRARNTSRGSEVGGVG